MKVTCTRPGPYDALSLKVAGLHPTFSKRYYRRLDGDLDSNKLRHYNFDIETLKTELLKEIEEWCNDLRRI